MSENMPADSQPNQPDSSQPVYPNRFEERMARREQRSEERWERRRARAMGGGAWIGGAVLILLGVIFLMQNAGMIILHNWWALFILLPAIGSFVTAWNAYRINGGRFSAAVRGSLIGGLILTLIAAFFLVDLEWGKLWPLVLILIGIGALFNALIPSSSN
jgi:hypothetical protein